MEMGFLERVPCNQGLTSDPWTPTCWSSHQLKARQQQPRPVAIDQLPIFLNQRQIQFPYAYHSELLEWSRVLNVLEGLLEVLQFKVDLVLGSLGILDSLNLEGGDGLELAVEVVGGGLEGIEAFLDLVNDSLVLEDAAVLGEVDGGRQLGQLLDLAADVVVALLEGLQRRNRLAAQAQGGGDFGPVELEGCGSLRKRKKISSGPKSSFVTNNAPIARYGSPNPLARYLPLSIDGMILTAAMVVIDVRCPRREELTLAMLARRLRQS